MLGDPGGGGRALKRDIERKLHAVLAGSLAQVPKVVKGAQLRQNGCVPAFWCADRPRRPDIVRARGHGVVLSLAERAADRVDWRHIQHIEAELLQVVQLPFHIAESAVRGRVRPLRARKQFIPGAVPGLHTVHIHRKSCIFGGVLGLPFEIGIAGSEREQFRGKRGRRKAGTLRCALAPFFQSRQRIAVLLQQLGRRGQRLCVLSLCPVRTFLQQQRPGSELQGHILPCVQLLLEVALPGIEVIDRCRDAVPVGTDSRRRKACLPTVVAERPQRCSAPALLPRRTNQQAGFHVIVAVGEDIGFHDHELSYDALGRKPAPIDFRGDMLNCNALLTLLRLRYCLLSACHPAPCLAPAR